MAVADTASLALSSHPASVGHARRFVRAWLGHLERTRVGEDLQLLASELVTNAIRHSDLSAVHVRRAGDAIRIEVDDRGTGEPRPIRSDDPAAPSGRGLLIVERLASRWGFHRLPEGGKRVWCEVRLPSAR